MTTQSIWDDLKKKSSSKSTSSASIYKELIDEEKTQEQSLSPGSSSNIYTLLEERVKNENIKPDTINNAQIEQVVDDGIFQRSKQAKTSLDLINNSYYVVSNPKTNQYFRLSEQDKFLWDHMDGKHTLRDLALEYFNHYGAFAYETIVALVYELKKRTLLTEKYVDIYADLSVWAKSKKLFYRVLGIVNHFLYWDFPIKNVDPFFGKLYNSFFRFFFNKISGSIALGIAIAGAVAFIIQTHMTLHSLFPTNNGFVGGVVVLILLNFVSLFFHEIAHGVATKHYGRKVHKAGFLLYFGWPSFYVDTTDMWMEEEKHRIIVSLIGPFIEVLIASVVSLSLPFITNPAINALIYKFAFVSYFSVFMNMNPLIEWDGYFVLTDLIGIPCLRQRSLYFIRNSFWKKIREKESFSQEESFFTIFGILSAFWSGVAFLLGIRFWEVHIARLFK